jgi:hypothetical protein
MKKKKWKELKKKKYLKFLRDTEFLILPNKKKIFLLNSKIWKKKLNRNKSKQKKISINCRLETKIILS